MDVKRLIVMDGLLSQKSTGKPQVFAAKVNVSERTLYEYLRYMKDELDAPIKYSRSQNTYYYAEQGSFSFKWRSN